MSCYLGFVSLERAGNRTSSAFRSQLAVVCISLDRTRTIRFPLSGFKLTKPNKKYVLRSFNKCPNSKPKFPGTGMRSGGRSRQSSSDGQSRSSRVTPAFLHRLISARKTRLKPIPARAPAGQEAWYPYVHLPSRHWPRTLPKLTLLRTSANTSSKFLELPSDPVSVHVKRSAHLLRSSQARLVYAFQLRQERPPVATSLD